MVERPGELLEQLHFDGVRPVSAVWPGLPVLAGDPTRTQLKGLGTGGCFPGPKMEKVGMVFVRICAGTFQMGSAADNAQAHADEKPAHEVTISKDFWIGKYEVTNEQYRQKFPGHQGDADVPATGVSWTEADAFCKSIGGRLPTEAEWEYSARAGSQTAWSFGDDESQLGRYAWYSKHFRGGPYHAGILEPNAWGLYDIHGNVSEWVSDKYGNYSAEAQIDPPGSETGEYHVLRGGSFISAPGSLRSAFRGMSKPEFRANGIGFRCVANSSGDP